MHYVPGFFQCTLFGRPLPFGNCVYLDVPLYNAAVQNLVYGVGMFHRQLQKAATHNRYIVPNICNNLSLCTSNFPEIYNTTPFKWLKLFNRSMYSLMEHGLP